MANVEERQLNLSLDDSDLQRGAKSAIKTLEKLDDALKLSGAAESIDKLQESINKVDFSKMAAALDVIADKLSFKNIIKASFVKNAVDDMYGYIKGKINGIRDMMDPVKITINGINQALTGGKTRATKIDQAKFKIEGLGQEWDKVSQRIDYGVTDTAYGFDQAANAASQLVAAGVEMSEVWDPNNVDLLGRSLRAISGAAAMTGANYDLISDIFIDSAAAGKVTTDALNRLAWQGLNAKKTLSDVLKVSQEEVGKMATKGQISFEMFADAMNDAYGEQATKSNETFEGSLDNMKAALNRIGAEFFFPIRKAGVQIFNATRLQLKAFKNLLGSTTDDVKDDFVDKFANIIQKGSDIISRFISSIPIDSFKGIIDYGGQVLDVIGGVLDGLLGWMDSIPWLAKKEEDTAATTTETVENIANAEEHLNEIAQQVMRGDFGNGEERRAALEALGESYEMVQNKVNELMDCDFRYEVSAEDMAKYTSQATEANENLVESQESQITATEKLAQAREDFNKSLEENLEKGLSSEERAKNFKSTLQGVKDSFEIVGKTIAAIGSGAAGPLTEFFVTLRDGFSKGTSSIGSYISKFKTFLDESGAYAKIQGATNTVLNVMLTGFKGLGRIGGTTLKTLRVFGSKALGIFGQLKDRVSTIWDAFKKTDGYATLTKGANTIKESLGNLWDLVFEKWNGFLDWLDAKEIKLPEINADTIAQGISDAITWIKTHIDTLKNAILGVFDGTTIDIEGFKTNIQNGFNDLINDPVEWAKSRLEDIKGVFKEIIGLFTGKGLNESEVDGTDRVMNLPLDEAKKKVDDLMNSLKGVDAEGGIAGIISTVTETFNNIKTGLAEDVEIIAGWGTTIAETLQKIVDGIIGFFTGAAAKIDTSGDAEMKQVMASASSVVFDAVQGSETLASVSEKFDAAKERFDNIVASIKDFFGDIKTSLEPIIEKIGDFLGPLKGKLPQSIDDVQDTISTLLQNFLAFNVVKGAAGALGSLWNFSGLLKQVKKGAKNINTILKSFKGIGDNVKGILESVKAIPDSIAAIPKSVAGVIDEAKASVTKVTDGFVAIEKSFSKALKGEARLRNAKALLLVVAAIAILALVVASLTKVDWQSENAHWAIGIMIGLIAAIAVLMLLMGTVFNGQESKAAAKGGDKIAEVLKSYKGIVKDFLKSIGKAATIAAIGMAVAAIGAVVVALSLIPWQKGIKGVLFAGLILFGLVKALGAIDKMTGGGLKIKVGILSIVLAIALGLLAGVVKKLGKLDVWTALKGIGFLYVIILELKEALKPIAEMELKGSVFKKAILMIVLIGVLKSMVNMVKTLGQLKYGTLIKGIVGMTVILFMLQGVIKQLGTMEHAKAGPILAITLAIGVLTGSMMMLGMMSGKKLAKAVIAILTIKTVLKSLVKSMQFTKDVKAGPILALVVVFGAIVAAIKILGDMDSTSLRNATLAIDSVMVVMSLLMRSIGSMTRGPSDKWKSILASVVPMIAAVGAAVGGILILDKFGSDAQRLKTIADSMSEIMLSLAAILAAMSLLPTSSDQGGIAGATMNNATNMLSALEWGAFGVALVGALGGIAELYENLVPEEIRQKVDFMMEKGKQIIFDVADFIGAVIGHLAKGILTPILGLVLGDGGMTGAVEKLTGFVEAIVPFVNDCDALPEDAKARVDRLVAVLQAMGAAGLAGIVDAILGNFLDMAEGWSETGGMMGLMTHLEAFMDRYKEFDQKLIDFEPKANDSKFQDVKDIFVALDELGLHGIITSLIGTFVDAVDGNDGTNMTVLLEKLGLFIQGYQIFARKLEHVQVSSRNIRKIENIGEIMSALNGVTVPAIKSGFFNWLMGGDEGSIGATEILTKLKGFLTEYTGFYALYKDIDADEDTTKVTNLIGLIDAFGDAAWSGAGADNANNSFTLVTDDGDTGLTQIVGKLQTFLEAYIAFYPWLEAALADEGQKTKIAEMGEIIGSFAGAAESASKISEYNDMIGVGESGKTGLQEIIDKLSGFLDSYGPFYDKLCELGIGWIAVNKVNSMRKIFEAFADSAWEGVRGKIATWITGEDGMGELVGAIGSAIANLHDTLTTYGADVEAMRSMMDNIQSIFTVMQVIYSVAQGVDSNTTASELTKIVGAIEQFFKDMALALNDPVYMEPLTNLGKGIFETILQGVTGSTDGEDASGSAAKKINEALFGSKELNTYAGKAAEEIVKSFMATFGATFTEEKNGENGLVSKVESMFTNDIIPVCITAIENSSTQFTGAMTSIVEGMRKSAQGLGWKLKSALQTALSSAVSTVRNYYTNFKSAGTYLMEGLAKGVTDNTSQVTTAMDAAAKAGLAAANDRTETKSPSRTTMRLGRYMMEGWAIGIRDNTVLTTDAASKSAISLVQTMSNSVHSEAESKSQELYNSLLGMYAYVNYAINEALDTQPTITPVMDLSMIQNGANSINGMLSGYSLGTGSLSYARSMFPGTSSVYSSQANHQAISAATVQGIREDIRSLGSAISNMQMVLDSGTLVGSIGGGMDRELGSIQKLRERWA